MIAFGLILTVGHIWLLKGMRRAKLKEQVATKDMEQLEEVSGQSERQLIISLTAVGTNVDEALQTLVAPFKVISDANGFSFRPLGMVRVVEIEGSATLSRVVAKEGKIIQRTTMGA